MLGQIIQMLELCRDYEAVLILNYWTAALHPMKNMSSVPLNDRPVSRAKTLTLCRHQNEMMEESHRAAARFPQVPTMTITPRGTTGMLGASTSTPMTSVSSLKVNRSSGTTVVMREVSESQKSLMSGEQADEGMNMSSWDGQVRTQQFDGRVSSNARVTASQEPRVEEPPLSRNNVVATFCRHLWLQHGFTETRGR